MIASFFSKEYHMPVGTFGKLPVRRNYLVWKLQILNHHIPCLLIIVFSNIRSWSSQHSGHVNGDFYEKVLTKIEICSYEIIVILKKIIIPC